MIRLLPENLINQIAAGEVVERPASVIKELVENSLDAGAETISITFEEGGKNLITIEDDGSGIAEQDLPKALYRHATSKLPSDDLEHINFFGFRGEALASIASVAKVKIISNHGEGAYSIEANGGEIGKVKPASLNRGTRVEIAELFYKTPARLKFLKSSSTEVNYINETIAKMAAANPQVKFFVNGKLKYDTHPGLNFAESLKLRLGEVLGSEFTQNSIYLETASSACKLRGFIGVPSFNKPTPSDEIFFVNGRSVRDKLVLSAVKNAYADVLFSGRYPALCLFIEVAPENVDVNVHPQKLEVRFRESGLVYGFITSSLKARLSQNDVASVKGGNDEKYFMQKISQNFGNMPSLQNSFLETMPASNFDLPQFSINSEANFEDNAVNYPLGEALAQIGNEFIVAKNQKGLVLVDQHAAHERIIYEKIKATLAKQEKVASQILLIPEVVNAPSIELVLQNLFDFTKMGFELEAFGEDSILVREIPSIFGDFDIKGFMLDMVSYLKEDGSKKTFEEKLKHICSTQACHSSIRAGKVLSLSEMNAILRQMEQTPNFSACGHGRPTYIEFDFQSLDKLFRRT